MGIFVETSVKPSRTTAFTCRAGCKERDVSKNHHAGPVKCNVMVRRTFHSHKPSLPHLGFSTRLLYLLHFPKKPMTEPEVVLTENGSPVTMVVLTTPPQSGEPRMAAWQLPAELVPWITHLSRPLHARLAWRLLPLVTGMLFARGRRTVASWLRGGGLGDDFRAYYYFLGSLGRNVKSVAALLLRRAVAVIVPGERVLLALDDTPTKRYGPHVEGAGIHHNPTPGPADQKFLYGHVWVTLAWVVRHPLWGAIGLPLPPLLYVRQKQIAWLHRLYGVTFRTKLEMAAELVEWAADWLRYLGKTLWSSPMAPTPSGRSCGGPWPRA